MWATVSHASTAASSDSKMSRQRMTTIGSVPLANSAAQAVALVLEAVDLDQVRSRVGAARQATERLRDLFGGADENVGELDRLLHRRLDGVEPERVRRLLRVVDDVVERGRQAVSLGGIEWRARAMSVGQAMDHVMGNSIALVLALADVLGKRGALGVVGEQVAQQQRGADDIATRFGDQLEQRFIRRPAQQRHRVATLRVPRELRVPFTTSSRLNHSFFTRQVSIRASLRRLCPRTAITRSRSASTTSR